MCRNLDPHPARFVRLPKGQGLICGEAVEAPGSAGGYEIFLAATIAHMRRIPGGVAAAEPVVMAEHGISSSVAGPIVTSCDVGSPDRSTTVGVGTREHIVLIRHVTDAVDRLPFLVERCGFPNVVAIPLEIAMKVRDILGHQHPGRVVPRTGADTISGIDRQ